MKPQKAIPSGAVRLDSISWTSPGRARKTEPGCDLVLHGAGVEAALAGVRQADLVERVAVPVVAPVLRLVVPPAEEVRAEAVDLAGLQQPREVDEPVRRSDGSAGSNSTPAGRVDSTQHHALAERAVVRLHRRRVRRVAVLDQPGGPGLVADVHPGPVHGQVGEEQYVARLGRLRRRRRRTDGRAGGTSPPGRAPADRPCGCPG